jgi:hypothetical protein
MSKLATVILYDAGFKEDSPALHSLANQTILEDIQVIWIEYYDKILPKVKEFDFITKVTLNMNSPAYNIASCYNAGLLLAKGKYFTLIDPCLWLPTNFLENIYSYHENSEDELFTFSPEVRGRDSDHAYLLTEEHHPNIWNSLGKPLEIGLKNMKNWGCASTALTESFRKVNGFDLFNESEEGMLVDRNTLALAIVRIRNLIPKLKIQRTGPLAYHPHHPRGEEMIAKGFLRNRFKDFSKNKEIIKAEKGLEYMNKNFTYSANDGTVEFRKI